MNVAMLLSCTSFEGFFGSVMGQTRESYLDHYRNDWAWYYARGLLENGIKPTIYIPSLREGGRYETDVGISVRFLPIQGWFKPFERTLLNQLSRQTRWTLYAKEYFNARAILPALSDALSQDRMELLYIQEYWSARFDLIVRKYDLPIAGADHGGLSTGVVKLFKRQAFKKAKVCYGQTSDECRIIDGCGGHSEWQPNGCDVSEFFPDKAVQRSKTVLTITRLTNKQKRTSDLIRAMAELPAEWSLDIVGTGPDRQMLEHLVADLKLSSRVRFHGFVDRKTVRDFLRRCGVYAMPSDNEAVALAALEAMACGAAVVLSRIRAFEQLVDDGKNGLLVAVGDVKSLAARIQDAWERRAMLGEAASAVVQKNYDRRILYAQLAKSLRYAVSARGH